MKGINQAVNYTNEQLEFIRKTLSGFKKYNPKLVPICGSVNAVILFLELQWLRDTFLENHGVTEFYHTDQQLRESLGFGRRQLDNAKDALAEKGLISYRVLGNKDKKTYYTVHVDNLMKCILEMYETYIPKCTKRTSSNVRFVHTKKNNKQDRINKTNNNKGISVDNSPQAPDASMINPCGAVPMRECLNGGNRTGVFLKLRDIPGISEKTAVAILNQYEDYQIINVLESMKNKRGRFTINAAAYFLGAMKQVKKEQNAMR
jgi:hypothetical protein